MKIILSTGYGVTGGGCRMPLSKIFFSPYYVHLDDGGIKEIYPCSDEETAKYVQDVLQKLQPSAIIRIQKGGDLLANSNEE